MALYKQAGSKYWWISIYTGRNKPRFRMSSGTEDRDKAELIERNLKLARKGDVQRDTLIRNIDELIGYNKETHGLPIIDILDTYKNLPEINVTPHTLAVQLRHGKKFIEYLQREWPTIQYMHEIPRKAVFDYADQLRAAANKGKTFNNTRGNLHRIFAALYFRANLTENIWSLVPTASTADSVSGRAFTPEEETRLFTACRQHGHQWYELSMIARYTGLRFTDIANLSSSNINGNYIELQPSKTKKHQITVSIPIHQKIERIIEQLSKKSGPLFPEHQTTTKNSDPKHSDFTKILQAAEIKPQGAKLSFHCWRHTFRTRLAEAGVPQETAMKLGGWTDAKTAEIYNHDRSALEKAIKAIN